MKKKISADKAPQAIGPYSQAIQMGNLLFVSGQIPIDPQTGNLVTGDIQAQTRQVMQNLKAIVESAGLTLADAVKATCFLKNMGISPNSTRSMLTISATFPGAGDRRGGPPSAGRAG